MSGEARLTVVAGPSKGREFVIPGDGSARAGRSSSNDIPVNDLSVSRFHCRFFFKPEKGLWVADLSSANHTLVNGKPVQEVQVKPQDLVTIGDTVIRVVSDGSAAVPAAPPPPDAGGGKTEQDVVDLGLAADDTHQKKSKPALRLVLLLLALVVMSGLVVWIFFVRNPARKQRSPVVQAPALHEGFEVRYERVDGTETNIFQYVLLIRDNKAGVQLHDVANNRHFSQPMTSVDSNVLDKLAADIQGTGFFKLQEDYSGSAASSYALRDLSVTIGLDTHRTKVLNTSEPADFEEVRKIVEEFGMNEFALRSLAYPREELVRLAGEATILGMKLHQEKNVRYENLFKAIRTLKEAAIYLETVDPKPDFYRDLTGTLAKCETELADICRDITFQADRAIRVKDWRGAAEALQILCATVPDRSDKIYQQAEQKLLEVQRHLKR